MAERRGVVIGELLKLIVAKNLFESGQSSQVFHIKRSELEDQIYLDMEIDWSVDANTRAITVIVKDHRKKQISDGIPIAEFEIIP